MKYMRIKNTGLIDMAALHLLGASTKRNDASKIGQFGSGNKYALAYFLRNDYNPVVYSGLQEIKITTKRESFRDCEFDIIYLNDIATSITTEMGQGWEFWQALRELYCNALDEGGADIEFVSEVEPKENETQFYLDAKSDVFNFIANFDSYFATKKKVLFECPIGRILEKTGKEANIYRRGIKCYTTKQGSVFDYDFNDIRINESRVVEYNWTIDEMLWDMIFRCDNEEVIMTILHQCDSRELIESGISDYSTLNPANMSDTFRECIKKARLAPVGYAGLLKPDEIHNHILIPTKIFRSIRGQIDDNNVGDKFKVMKNGGVFREVEPTPLWDDTLKQALEFLKEVKFDIPYEVVVAIFDDKTIQGVAFDGRIILSNICLEKGVNETVNTITEEFIHLKYDVADETRAFQTATITEFISYMKKVNAYTI
jgi:hypothetical protein